MPTTYPFTPPRLRNLTTYVSEVEKWLSKIAIDTSDMRVVGLCDPGVEPPKFSFSHKARRDFDPRPVLLFYPVDPALGWRAWDTDIPEKTLRCMVADLVALPWEAKEYLFPGPGEEDSTKVIEKPNIIALGVEVIQDFLYRGDVYPKVGSSK